MVSQTDVNNQSNTLGRALREIWTVINGETVMAYALGVVTFFILTYGCLTKNISVMSGFLAGLAIIFSKLTWHKVIKPYGRYLNQWLLEGSTSENAWDEAFGYNSRAKREVNSTDILALAVFVLFISSCVFLGKYRAWIINGKPMTSSWSFAIPFVNDIDGASYTSVDRYSVNGTTKDGVPVTATMIVDLKLTGDKSAWKPQSQIEESLKKQLPVNFQSVIGKINAAEIPASPVQIEHLIGQMPIDPSVRFNGPLKITDLHASVKK